MTREMIISEELEPPSPHNLATSSSLSPTYEVALSRIDLSAVPSPSKTIPLKTNAFYRRFFKGVSAKEYNNWQWQLNNRIMSLFELKRFLHLSEDEIKAFYVGQDRLPLSITPYYLSLIDPHNAEQPLRKSVIPTQQEFTRSVGDQDDPLAEDQDSSVRGVVHRYPDRALFLVTNSCSVYCRYCTRSRMVGECVAEPLTRADWEKAIQYIAEHTEIRDVLLSGGDPLTMSDEALEWLLSRLRKIPHVEMIRIGTKTPAVLPQRITPALCKMLKKYHPLYLSLHFTHPDELTKETAKACERLADAGIPLGSQTVLLADINDNVDTMKKLMQGLLRIRVKPYYIFQCDPIIGSGHFRTPIEKGLEIIQGLRGYTSGYAVPAYVIDAPGGGGKIPLLPEYVQGREGQDIVLKNYEGKQFRYPDPICD
ncbi:MAG: lysine 2,3-aminomutase [Gammaproteobacteria bacterium GWE2_42_36]|nr:MAG: lysine 2,3-aminomutase [Gammaproteobacteria bacterium GWE2_42_36]